MENRLLTQLGACIGILQLTIYLIHLKFLENYMVKKLRARVLDTYVIPYVGPQGDIRCKLLF